MGVFPMAPFPGNDHSITPTPARTAMYLKYGGLYRWCFGPMHALVYTQQVQKLRFYQIDYDVNLLLACHSSFVQCDKGCRVATRRQRRNSGVQRRRFIDGAAGHTGDHEAVVGGKRFCRGWFRRIGASFPGRIRQHD